MNLTPHYLTYSPCFKPVHWINYAKNLWIVERKIVYGYAKGIWLELMLGPGAFQVAGSVDAPLGRVYSMSFGIRNTDI
jgi:hypothetical protein